MAETAEHCNEILLVLRCQSGDREAFDELLKSIQTKLWRYISNLAGDRDLAEDIMQEVFLIIYRKIGWLNDPRVFRPWVYRIASRETFRMLKKRSAWREDAGDNALMNLPVEKNDSDSVDLAENLPQMIEAVSPASRAVLMLHYLEEMTLSETANILDISLGTAKSRLAYGLTQLRKHLI